MLKRVLVLALVAGCNTDGLSTQPYGARADGGASNGGGGSGGTIFVDAGVSGSNGGGGGTTTTGGSGGGGNGGGGGTATTTTGGGGGGALCKTACDCQAGLACFQNQCIMSMLGPLFCCESSNCPDGQFCQSQMGGFQMCGGNSGGGPGPGGGTGPNPGGPPSFDFGVPDLGVTDGGGNKRYCRFIPCMDDNICSQSGCGTCNTSNNRCEAP